MKVSFLRKGLGTDNTNLRANLFVSNVALKMNVRKLFLSTSLRNITSTMRGALEFRRLDWQRNICTGHPIFIPLTERTLIQRGCFNWERLYCTSGQTLVAVYSEIKDLPKHPEKLLIDVREPREIDEYGKIPGSINIPQRFTCRDEVKLREMLWIFHRFYYLKLLALCLAFTRGNGLFLHSCIPKNIHN
ncbi:unnamed protein product [Hermetia illucens]|uniref:Rhodanese domain-containing protein n=1 Tax=Hermetia illucens TaxID=343691 RepID=A0A7R8UJ16_HERIL|nr:unnamed protein product [Hermetia illucens]